MLQKPWEVSAAPPAFEINNGVRPLVVLVGGDPAGRLHVSDAAHMVLPYHKALDAAREALNNTIRHAGATKVSLRLAVSHSVLRIDIEDDGRGFDPANADTGNGLANMRRRLDHCGGTCRVESKLGEGTSVVFSFPVSTEPSLCQPP